jgi:predicted Zn-dependent protease
MILNACATSPLGRKQLIFVPDSQMNEMGAQAFQQMKSSQPVDKNTQTQKYVNCVVDPLTRLLGKDTFDGKWEVVVFQDSSANAFALPGGKIGVHTGLLKVARTDSQLAAVIGHEIGHVIAKHGAERVSQQTGTQVGLTALGALTPTNPNKDLLMGLLGVGTQVGILLPFSRTQESEADLIGLDLMSRAGFDPNQSVELWQNMIAASGGGGPPKWLSTHPASEDRIKDLQKHMGSAAVKYDQARAAGHEPQCDRSKLKF